MDCGEKWKSWFEKGEEMERRRGGCGVIEILYSGMDGKVQEGLCGYHGF